MARHNDIGLQGEKAAYEYLREKGYEILEQNWRSGKAEIDLIARREEVLIIVEVKTRSSTFFGQPEEFVDARKVKFLTSAAGDYMRKINHQWEVRFDIISVVISEQNVVKIKHIRDAFFLGLQ